MTRPGLGAVRPSAAAADDEVEQAPPAMPDTGGVFALAVAVPALLIGALRLAARRRRGADRLARPTFWDNG